MKLRRVYEPAFARHWPWDCDGYKEFYSAMLPTVPMEEKSVRMLMNFAYKGCNLSVVVSFIVGASLSSHRITWHWSSSIVMCLSRRTGTPVQAWSVRPLRAVLLASQTHDWCVDWLWHSWVAISSASIRQCVYFTYVSCLRFERSCAYCFQTALLVACVVIILRNSENQSPFIASPSPQANVCVVYL